MPSSNSWFPTALRSRPIRFIASIVGSSWKSADSSGLAPMRSPAETTKVLRFASESARTCVARYSAPPAFTVPTRPLEPLGGRRFPWKSLRARSWTSTSEPFWMIGGLLLLVAPVARMSAATTATRATNVSRMWLRIPSPLVECLERGKPYRPATACSRGSRPVHQIAKRGEDLRENGGAAAWEGAIGELPGGRRRRPLTRAASIAARTCAASMNQASACMGRCGRFVTQPLHLRADRPRAWLRQNRSPSPRAMSFTVCQRIPMS